MGLPSNATHPLLPKAAGHRGNTVFNVGRAGHIKEVNNPCRQVDLSINFAPNLVLE